MSDAQTPGPLEPRATAPQSDPATLGALAHRMNNALAFVTTNLSLLQEELMIASLPEAARQRMAVLLAEATDGASQASDHVRQLKVLYWGGAASEPPDCASADDDTWDTGPARVLVCDDEPQILSAVSRALRHLRVTVAQDGADARALIEGGHSFDVILCDVLMREVNGIELFRWLEAERPHLLGRLVFMTAGAYTPDVRRFLSAVPNQVLHKPFDTKTLRWVVAQKVRTVHP